MLDKIMKRAKFQSIHFIILLTLSTTACTQPAELSIVSKFKIYKELVAEDSSKRMIELKTIVPNLRYDLRYATLNNFLHQRLYRKENETFLRLPAGRALAKTQQELNEKGFGLKIWDAYRPYSVTVKMWEPIKDDRYVADPKKGSGHNRGTAVDLTIVNLKDGKELNMGTDFDNFSDTANQTFTNLPEEILQNRLLLKSTMEKYGFIALATEWWHFYWKDAKKFELLNIPFKKFRK
jgi:D-alanyl-D-alanine dipeptidase